LISLLIILSYAYSALSYKTKIPSVLMLLATGVGARIAFDQLGYELPETRQILEFFGIVGLILIVLEGALDLRLRRDKFWIILRSFFSAMVILVVSSLSIAFGLQIFLEDISFYTCLVNAIPFAVISSAIAIPSVGQMQEQKKEFIIYESIFSDILGILFFNAVVNNPTFEVQSAAWMISDFFIIVLVSLLVSALIIVFIDKTTMNIKFFLMIAVMVLLYSFGKMVHLSSLLMILFFGLILNNIDLFAKKRLKKHLNLDKLQDGIERFKLVTNESAFLIRTIFFFVFGFTLHLNKMFDPWIIITGIIIVGIIYFLRFLFLKFLAHRHVVPELYVAPRGLITILLFYSIPRELSLGIISEGVLFFVIIISSIVMMFGLMGFKEKIPEMEIYIGDKKVE
jgi:Kef-type K+ transport system membrane component KefB